MESCCTCARLLTTGPRDPDFPPSSSVSSPSSSEKPVPVPEDRRPACCGRVICGACIRGNPRFGAYCPYCQVAEDDTDTGTALLLPPGLKAPPSYDASVTPGVGVSSNTAYPTTGHGREPPPPYTVSAQDAGPEGPASGGGKTGIGGEKKKDKAEERPRGEDTQPPSLLHYLRQPHDTVASLSLQYGVPAAALRRANGIHSDHLIAGRRTVVIPIPQPPLSPSSQSASASGHGRPHITQSLSPRPPGGEEAERRERALRRWMLRCRVHEYDVAALYLANAAWDPEAAVVAYLADEAWERAHPVEEARRGRRGWGGGLGRVRS